MVKRVSRRRRRSSKRKKQSGGGKRNGCMCDKRKKNSKRGHCHCGPKKASLSDIKKIAKKYSVTDNGSRAHISAVLCSARSSYLSKKERKMILPFLKNSKNKTILLQMIKTNETQKKLPQ